MSFHDKGSFLFKYFFLHLFLFFSITWCQTEGKLGSIQLNEKTVFIEGESRKGPYFLPDSLIISNSIRVYVSNQLQPESAYHVDAISGELRFTEIIEINIPIRIEYKVYPFELEEEYYHHKMHRQLFGIDTKSQIDRSINKEDTLNYASKLNKSGSITRGISVGNTQGLKVNSALNINVSGKVGENIEVLAALTDQSTPIQPEGTTQNLQEIDKVFVKIKSPHFSATMGDFNISYSGSQFAQYNRKLQGVMGEGSFENISIKASGAVTRGKYRSIKFQGQEGNQGPYQLKGNRGQVNIIVLAGTERVYIDGERMTRGESHDYTIDYSSAQITFTRRQLITSESRIIVDFQYSDEQYRRNLYSSYLKTNLGHGLSINTTFLHESDDKDNPLDFTLKDDYLDVLSTAGDNQLKARISGATFVGENKGRYTLTKDSVYVYQGENEGNYNVTFSDVGDDSGSYTYKGSGIFEYTGKGQGRYDPIIILPTPSTHSILDIDIQFNPLRFLSLTSEFAISNYDQNTFSTIDDSNNQGIAQHYKLSLQPDSMRVFGMNVGSFNLSALYKHLNRRFNSLDRIDEIEYNRKWDLPQSSETSAEQVIQLNGSYIPATFLKLNGEYGTNKRGVVFNSKRWSLHENFNLSSFPSIEYKIESINSHDILNHQHSEWIRHKGKIDYTLDVFNPFMNYERETKKENWTDSLYTGFRFDDVELGMNLHPSDHINSIFSFSQRNESNYVNRDQFEKKSLAKTFNTKTSFNYKSFTTNLVFTHREMNYFSKDDTDIKTDLAELQMQWSSFHRALNVSLNYQISNTATAKKERVYIKVNEGEGNYRFDKDLNEYVNDPLGNFILRILTTDQFEPVAELKTVSRLQFEPSHFYKSKPNEQKSFFRKGLEAFSSDTYFTLEERSQYPDVYDVYFFNMDKFQSPEYTILGTTYFREDIFMFKRNRDFSLRYRFEKRNELNNQYLQGGEERQEHKNSFRFNFRFLDNFSSQTEYTRKHISRYFNYTGRQNRDIFSHLIESDVSFRPSSVLEFSLKGRFSSEKDVEYDDPTEVNSYALIPQFNYSIRNRGRFRSELEWSYVNSSPSGRLIPYEMALGRSVGYSTRWDIRFDYRISDVIMATVSYSGRNEPDRDQLIHAGKAQVTASFR